MFCVAVWIGRGSEVLTHQKQTEISSSQNVKNGVIRVQLYQKSLALPLVALAWTSFEFLADFFNETTEGTKKTRLKF